MSLHILTLSFLALTTATPTRDATQLSSGCAKPLPSQVALNNSTNQCLVSKSGLSPRDYRIHVPSSYRIDTPVPLILSYHGRTQDAKYQENLSQFSNASYGFKGIAVYPQGAPSSKGVPQWQGDPDSHGIDDVLFTNELLDQLMATYCIDPTRIYATGKSNGGGFVGQVLACDEGATKRVAAFAPVSGAFYLQDGTRDLPPCTPTKDRKVIPIMEFHGWKDKTIPYLGGLNTRGNANSSSIVKWVDSWVKRDGFDVNSNKTTKLCTGKGEKVVIRYSWGDDEIVHYNNSNLGHVWPSTFPNEDGDVTTCKEAAATSVILEWFGRWRL